MPVRRVLFLAAAALLLPGCIAFSNLSPSDTKVSNFEAIVVMGVDPRYRVGIGKGTSSGDGLWTYEASVLDANVFPEDGYVVLKLPARNGGESYGLVQILPGGIGGAVPRYSPCGGRTVPVFEAPPGDVVYVGDLRFTDAGGALQMGYDHNFPKAVDVLRKTYPALVEQIRAADITFPRTSNMPCRSQSTSVPMIITVPAPRR